MTVHKSQGSQARTVSVVLPDEESRLLTRELFYTAVTRAQEQGARRRHRGGPSGPPSAARCSARAGWRDDCRTRSTAERYFSSDSASLIWANSSSGALATRWCRL